MFDVQLNRSEIVFEIVKNLTNPNNLDILWKQPILFQQFSLLKLIHCVVGVGHFLLFWLIHNFVHKLFGSKFA
jgi:hypothetical protein